MPIEKPQHTGHTFVGFRGTSKAHFYTDKSLRIRYLRPPPSVTGADQLGAGIYVTDSLNVAREYAQDQAWNLYVSKYPGKDDGGRSQFELQQWRLYGDIHAVFMPDSKYEKRDFADFSHIEFDRDPSFMQNNANRFLTANSGKLLGTTTEYQRSEFDPMKKTQTIIYPPHIGSLYVKDVTDEAIAYLRTPDAAAAEQLKEAAERS